MGFHQKSILSKPVPSGWRGREYLYQARSVYMALMWSVLQKNFGKLVSNPA